jgi:hypothetical protein
MDISICIVVKTGINVIKGAPFNCGTNNVCDNKGLSSAVLNTIVIETI